MIDCSFGSLFLALLIKIARYCYLAHRLDSFAVLFSFQRTIALQATWLSYHIHFVLSNVFLKSFFKVSFSFALSICLCSPLCRATYEIISHLLLSVNWLFLRSFGLRLTGSWLKRVLLYQFDAAVSRGFSWSVFKKGRGFRVVVAASLQYIWGDARR